MYRILIVDDESIERKGLRKVITDEFPNVTIEEADNGRTAILKAEEFRPDVIFMDIKMPGIDGIEACREIKKLHPSVHIIMVTAFDTFEYARQVMKIGVRDYILKPSTKEEITTPLRKVLTEVEREKEKRKEEIILKDNYRRALSIVQSKVITAMLMEASYGQHLGDLQLEQNFQRDSFVLVVEAKKKQGVVERINVQELMSYIQAELGHFYHQYFLGEENMGRIPVLVQLTDREKNKVREYALKSGQELINKGRSLFSNVELSIGIGRVYNEVEKLVQSYHEALFALSMARSAYSCKYYNDHVDKAEHTMSSYPYKLEKKVLETVTSGQTGDVASYFQQYFDALMLFCEKSTDILEEKLSEFFILLSRQIAESGVSVSFDRHQLEMQPASSIQNKLVEISQHIHKMYHSQNKDVLVMAKEYIDQHYKKAITLEEVADEVKLSPQYFSKIFKSRANCSFIDYLTEIRVEKAKELIRLQESSVKEICYEVGYKDPNYFSRVFKNQYGLFS
ncbi:helix-turn-helix [Halalkalibacter wakoensis JCM 9140]|uniref:Helix-turn-helix n=1 Tax=Halalkalibacter wakoensis JCM 9140 TaxID=1236970 RepID=W4Q5V4_9BACI|nr:response regulator [Halalkalibacter wakoensis]GAE26754.1 helix-turn-helix [Halalkalibacter wakoensis JCM 9140]